MPIRRPVPVPMSMPMPSKPQVMQRPNPPIMNDIGRPPATVGTAANLGPAIGGAVTPSTGQMGGMGGGATGATNPMMMKKGGSVKSSASKRADGIAQRGKTKGKYL